MNSDVIIQEKLYEAEFYRKEHDYNTALIKYQNLYRLIKNNIQDYEKYGITILKKICFCYRKTGNMQAALSTINEALHLAHKNSLCSKNNNDFLLELAICYMNKGTIYDASEDFKHAIENYLLGLKILKDLVKQDTSYTHIVINGLLNLGTAYYNENCFDLSLQTFEELCSLLGNNKNTDQRGIYAKKYMQKIKKEKE